MRISVFACSLLSADSPRESDATRPESGPKRPPPITLTDRSDDVENAGDVGREGEKEADEWRDAERFRGRVGLRFRGGDWPGRGRVGNADAEKRKGLSGGCRWEGAEAPEVVRGLGVVGAEAEGGFELGGGLGGAAEGDEGDAEGVVGLGAGGIEA